MGLGACGGKLMCSGISVLSLQKSETDWSKSSKVVWLWRYPFNSSRFRTCLQNSPALHEPKSWWPFIFSSVHSSPSPSLIRCSLHQSDLLANHLAAALNPMSLPYNCDCAVMRPCLACACECDGEVRERKWWCHGGTDQWTTSHSSGGAAQGRMWVRTCGCGKSEGVRVLLANWSRAAIACQGLEVSAVWPSRNLGATPFLFDAHVSLSKVLGLHHFVRRSNCCAPFESL